MHSDIDSEAGARTRATVFFDLTSTFGALLGSPKSIHFGKKLSTLPAHMLDDGSKLTKRSIEHVFSKHPFSASTVI